MNKASGQFSALKIIVLIVLSIVFALLVATFFGLIGENATSYHPDVSVIEYYGESGEYDDVYFNSVGNNENTVPAKYHDMYIQLDGVGDYFHYELLARSKKQAGKEDDYKKYSARAKEASTRAGEYSNFIHGVDRVLNDYEKRGN